MALMDQVKKSAAPKIESQEYGPWLGSWRSSPPEQVPPEYITAVDATTPSNNFLYVPRIGSWKLRGGATEKFDTFGTEVGLLPALWTNDPMTGSGHSRNRHQEEFLSESVTDNIPTQIALLTRETVPSTVLDDGRFSNVWIRDQVNSLNYTIGSEYGAVTYPPIGSTQTHRVVPLWYDSGDGGITRGVSERLRKFFFDGSRRFLKVGNWWYFPSVLGTPSRWRGRFIPTEQTVSSVRPSGTDATGDWRGQDGGTSLHTYVDEVTADDADYIKVKCDGTEAQVSCQLTIPVPSPLPSASAVHTLRVRYQRTGTGGVGGATGPGLDVAIYKNNVFVSGISNLEVTPAPSGWIDATDVLSAADIAALTDYTGLEIYANWTGSSSGVAVGSEMQISQCYLDFGGVSAATLETNANRLIPSGPFSPTHAGSLAKGTVAAGTVSVNLTPDADDAGDLGNWLNELGSTPLYTSINDTSDTGADTTYITASGTTDASVSLSNPGFLPTGTTHRVTIRIRARKTSLFGSSGLSVDLYEGQGGVGTGTERSVGNVGFGTAFTTSFANYSYELTPAEVNSIAAEANWNDLFLVFDVDGTTPAYQVSRAYLEISPIAGSLEGGWTGKDRFFYSVAYRFEDGSIWMPCTPRFPNTLLSSGYNMFTVDSANTSLTYDKVIWSNIPIGPHGTISRLLLRSPKIDSTVDDNLQLNPTDLRLVHEIQDNTTTTYDDYGADDASLTLDLESYFIRYDHRMSPRTRYLVGGDMRVLASYGGDGPCAIQIAPVGRAADYDLNLADSADAAYTSQGSWMQIKHDTSGVGTLTLIQGDGATATNTKTFDLTAGGSYDTLQKLTDGINATNFATDGQQWRAQIAPGANPDATSLSLVPHNRAIASCVIDNTAKTITKAAGGLSKVAVGQLISGAAEETSAFVTIITSDTSLTYSGTLTTGTETLYFYNELGDDQVTDSDTTALGFQRVIANSLPAFLYFTKTYLNTQTFDKSATWMTVASPGSSKSAPNCFSGKGSNRFTPPLGAGICQGGGAVDQGFVVLYGNKVGAIRPRGPDSNLDQDYTLIIIDESRGCCAWNTVIPGNRFVPFLSAEGMFAADLETVKLISEAIYVDQPTSRGDFSYEGPQSIAATAMDSDGSYAWARVLRGVLWVGYRTSASTTHVNRRVRLDFSSGDEATGLRALYRRPGVLWGWSTPLLGASAAAGGSYSMMAEGRRDDGFHLYGWHDTSGSVGDGRLDEVETTGTTDNGTAITGRIEVPWLRPPDGELISGQEMILEHSSPVGSTGELRYHRTFSDDSYTLTPGTSALGVYSELKFLPQPARANANAAFVDYRQLTGSQRELRRLVLKFYRIRRLKT